MDEFTVLLKKKKSLGVSNFETFPLIYHLRSCEVSGFFSQGLPVTGSNMDLEK